MELNRLGVDNRFILPDLEGLGHQITFELMNDINRPWQPQAPYSSFD